MKHKVKFKVLPTVEPLATFKYAGEIYSFASAMTRFVECMESIGEKVPYTMYEVTYTLAPKHGRLYAHGGSLTHHHMFLEPAKPRKEGKHWDSVLVCQLPIEWRDKRVNRKVRPCAGEEVEHAGLPTTEMQRVRKVP